MVPHTTSAVTLLALLWAVGCAVADVPGAIDGPFAAQDVPLGIDTRLPNGMSLSAGTIASKATDIWAPRAIVAVSTEATFFHTLSATIQRLVSKERLFLQGSINRALTAMGAIALADYTTVVPYARIGNIIVDELKLDPQSSLLPIANGVRLTLRNVRIRMRGTFRTGRTPEMVSKGQWDDGTGFQDPRVAQDIAAAFATPSDTGVSTGSASGSFSGSSSRSIPSDSSSLSGKFRGLFSSKSKASGSTDSGPTLRKRQDQSASTGSGTSLGSKFKGFFKSKPKASAGAPVSDTGSTVASDDPLSPRVSTPKGSGSFGSSIVASALTTKGTLEVTFIATEITMSLFNLKRRRGASISDTNFAFDPLDLKNLVIKLESSRCRVTSRNLAVSLARQLEAAFSNSVKKTLQTRGLPALVSGLTSGTLKSVVSSIFPKIETTIPIPGPFLADPHGPGLQVRAEVLGNPAITPKGIFFEIGAGLCGLAGAPCGGKTFFRTTAIDRSLPHRFRKRDDPAIRQKLGLPGIGEAELSTSYGHAGLTLAHFAPSFQLTMLPGLFRLVNSALVAAVNGIAPGTRFLDDTPQSGVVPLGARLGDYKWTVSAVTVKKTALGRKSGVHIVDGKFYVFIDSYVFDLSLDVAFQSHAGTPSQGADAQDPAGDEVYYDAEGPSVQEMRGADQTAADFQARRTGLPGSSHGAGPVSRRLRKRFFGSLWPASQPGNPSPSNGLLGVKGTAHVRASGPGILVELVLVRTATGAFQFALKDARPDVKLDEVLVSLTGLDSLKARALAPIITRALSTTAFKNRYLTGLLVDSITAGLGAGNALLAGLIPDVTVALHLPAHLGVVHKASKVTIGVQRKPVVAEDGVTFDVGLSVCLEQACVNGPVYASHQYRIEGLPRPAPSASLN